MFVPERGEDVAEPEGKYARASKATSACARRVSGAWTCGWGPLAGNPDQDQATRELGSESRS